MKSLPKYSRVCDMPREVFDAIEYDPDKGSFSSDRYALQDYKSRQGWLLIVCGQSFYAHRLAIAKIGIDVDALGLEVHHVNFDPFDNRLHNLFPIEPLVHRQFHAQIQRLRSWYQSDFVFGCVQSPEKGSAGVQPDLFSSGW